MADAPFSDALHHYQQLLDQLQKPDAEQLPPLKQRALDVLLARDTVQAILEEETSIPAHLLLDLEAGDRTLKHHKNRITQHPELKTWRTLVNPPEDAWWWYLDPPACFSWLEQKHPWLDSLDWLWMFLSLFALSLSFTVVLDTLNRVVGEGLNTSGMFPVVVQVLLTLTGSAAALTKTGRRFLETAMARLRIPRHYWQELSLVVSVIVLVLVFGIHEAYLPRIAQTRNQQGIAAHEAEKFDSALQAYQQAIALRPDFTEAHFNLGSLYEDLQKVEEAIAEYEQVVNSDFELNPEAFDNEVYLKRLLAQLRAYNNLGRLYILQGSDQNAWLPLDRGLNLIPAELAQSNSEVAYEYYNLLKNMAWVRVLQERYLEADTLANEAIALDSQRAPAYCLKAEALDAQKNYEAALPIWESCVQHADGDNPDEDRWIGMAYAAFNREEPSP